MRTIVLVLSLIFHAFAILDAQSTPQHEEIDSDMVLVVKHNNESQMVVTNDDMRNIEEERVLETEAIAKILETGKMKTTDALDDNPGFLYQLKRWPQSAYQAFRSLLHRWVAHINFETAKKLLDRKTDGFDEAIVQGFTPNFINTMIEFKTRQGEDGLPSSTVVDELAFRFRDLLGIPGTTDTPVSLNGIWDATVSRGGFFNNLNNQLRTTKALIEKDANVDELMSFDVHPILYKKALLDLDILDESKTYTLEEWNANSKLQRFLEYLEFTNNMPVPKSITEKPLEVAEVAA
ncbi:RxLR-like protein [Plasmopara halstedii]|uniref:RxLR-like protein n=1 Tax=Plasmopara halstedii TaxID=4781 RepID=A0A0P1AL60_PLAHL|nr:RxLR-like protein [Plasmopara halstedii]CEG41412.1 RxLR-like protein [Plasmopara halstedii]|eukprot:XP_024577781.1 RxLR-like protein [Plasmopara halstedii]